MNGSPEHMEESNGVLARPNLYDPWSSFLYDNDYRKLNYWQMSDLLQVNQVMEPLEASSPSEKDDELDRIVCCVVSEGPGRNLSQGLVAHEAQLQENAESLSPESQAKSNFSFDDEVEKLKNLLRKSKESFEDEEEDEVVGSMVTFKRPEPVDTPPASAPASDLSRIRESSDTMIVLPKTIASSQHCSDTGVARDSKINYNLKGGLNSHTSSQLFNGTSLFDAVRHDFTTAANKQVYDIYDDFRQNGHDVTVNSSSDAPWGSVRSSVRMRTTSLNYPQDGETGSSVETLNDTDTSIGRLPNEDLQRKRASSAEPELCLGDGKDTEEEKSWATVMKKAGGLGRNDSSSAGKIPMKQESKIDVAAEQRLCRILERFIEEFSLPYEEARLLLEWVQVSNNGQVASHPLSSVLTLAREFLSFHGGAVPHQVVVAPPVPAIATPPTGGVTIPGTNFCQQFGTSAAVKPAVVVGQMKEEDLPWNFKTVMCNFFKEGTCRQGSKCMYAHSKVELREPIIPVGYCIAFVTKGVCKWGSNCNYIHEIPSLPKKQLQMSDKVKLIKAPESKMPQLPVGMTYAGSPPGVVATPGARSSVTSFHTDFPAMPGLDANTTKTKNKKSSQKEEEEWSTVSKGPKPIARNLESSPAVIVNAFGIDNLCVLCREQVSSSNNRISLDCGHSEFHRGCIKDWLKSHGNSCPVCKKTVWGGVEPDEANDTSTKKNKK